MTVQKAEKIIGINIKKEFKEDWTFEQAEKHIPIFRKKVKKLFREKSKQIHPDINDEKHGEEFIELKKACDLLLLLNIVPKNKSQNISVNFLNDTIYFTGWVSKTPVYPTTGKDYWDIIMKRGFTDGK